jgi:hypothetical protein
MFYSAFNAKPVCDYNKVIKSCKLSLYKRCSKYECEHGTHRICYQSK